jgi:putative ABC transport system permease protein
MWSDLPTDVRLAVRSLLKDRGFTLPAILTLGLGMTLCAAVFSVVNAYLVQTLPYPEASRLYNVRYGPPGSNVPRSLESLDWSALASAVEHPIAWDLDVFYILGGDHAESASGAWVTPGFIQGLGIAPAIGRGFDADAFVPGSPQMALISHRLWQMRFAGDLNIVGRRFQAYVSDRPDETEVFTIIGVLPREFWHMNPYTDILTPLRAPTYPYLVRLREGVRPTDAAARMTALVRRATSGLAADWRVDLVSTHEQYVSTVRPILNAVAGAAALVLLIAWANVAGLLIVRATRRRKEIAVRMALGAGRTAIARLLILEGLVLGANATAIGLASSSLLMRWLAPLIQRQLGRTAPGGAVAFATDGTIIAGAAIVGVLIAVACGLAPLALSWRVTLQGLHGGGRTGTEGRGAPRTRSVLIALEVAASLALLAGSLLMVQTVVRSLRVDLGIRAEGVLTTAFTLRERSYPAADGRLAFYERTIARLAALPGVESVALRTGWPLQPPRPETVETGDGGTTRAGVATVTSEYFATLKVPITAGRTFTSADRLGNEAVAIASETLARRLWPNRTPIGAHVLVADRDEARDAPRAARRVVGIVRDVRQTAADDDLADLYVPMLQQPGRFSGAYVRAAHTRNAGALFSAVRAAFAKIDPDIAIGPPRLLQDAIDEQSSRPRFLAWLLGGFALVAGLLALVGVYGVIAYAVRQREREIAVRMAIGADARIITRLFLQQGGVVLALGLALGLVGAVGAGRALESQLFGVGPSDPFTLVMTLTGFGAAGLCAIWWPARRAARTDPAALLKEE